MMNRKHRNIFLLAAALCLFTQSAAYPWMCSSEESGLLLPTLATLPSNAAYIAWWGSLNECDESQKFSHEISLADMENAFTVKIMVDGVYQPADFSIERPFNIPEVDYPHTYTTNELRFLKLPNIVPGDRLFVSYDPNRRAHCRKRLGEKLPVQKMVILVSEEDFGLGKSDAELWVGDLQKAKKKILEYGMGDAVRKIAAVPVELVSERFERWKDILWVETYVDGRLWKPQEAVCVDVPPGDSWVGKGKELIFLDCEDQEIPESAKNGFTPMPLLSGEHEVRMVASLPGTNAFIEASATITVQCD